MKWRVLVSAPYAMPHLDWYRSQLEAADCEMVVADVRERLSEEELLPIIGDVDGLICGDDRVTDRVLAAAPRLKVISKWGTGIDSLDQDAARRRHVTIRNTPNAFSEPVADTVLGYTLLFARQLDRMTTDIRSGHWRKPQLVSLREWTIGVIGVGNCGRAVVRRATAFGMKILGNDPVDVPADLRAATGLEMVGLSELLQQSDVVTLHTSLNPTSHHLMNDRNLGLMKPGAHLINTSRGPVVQEEALVRALAGGRLGGAALDVFVVEPLPSGSPLRQFPTCHFGAHNANSSPAAAQRVHENTLRNLIEELNARG